MADEYDPVAEPVDVYVDDTSIAVVDLLQHNVKVFSHDHHLMYTFGRLGDGPGEFRNPISVARAADGSWLVLDSRMRLSFFSPDGAYLRRLQLTGLQPVAAEPLRNGDAVLVSVRSTPRERLEYYGMQYIDYEGSVARRLHPLPVTTELYRDNFRNVKGTQVGSRVAAIVQDMPNLYVFGEEGKLERVIAVAAPWYRAPEWPRERATDVAAVTAWGNAQMWTFILEALNDSTVLMGFSRYGGDDDGGTRYYALVNIVNGTVTIDSAPRSEFVTDIHDGHAYSVVIASDGQAILQVTPILGVQ